MSLTVYSKKAEISILNAGKEAVVAASFSCYDRDMKYQGKEIVVLRQITGRGLK